LELIFETDQVSRDKNMQINTPDSSTIYVFIICIFIETVTKHVQEEILTEERENSLSILPVEMRQRIV
jgi:hypothetical protein